MESTQKARDAKSANLVDQMMKDFEKLGMFKDCPWLQKDSDEEDTQKQTEPELKDEKVLESVATEKEAKEEKVEPKPKQVVRLGLPAN